MPDSPDHFAAYSFVDRIDELRPAGGARDVSSRRTSRAFPRAWSPRRSGSSRRGSRWTHRLPRPAGGSARHRNAFSRGCRARSRRLELAVDIDECDDEAVAYNGTRSVERQAAVIELVDCLGPMLPVGGLRRSGRAARAASRCCAAGAPRSPWRFRGVLRIDVTVRTRSRRLVARDASTFRAPRRSSTITFRAAPVFPGDAAARCADATRAASSRVDRRLGARRDARCRSRVTHVKMRSFITPGQQVDLDVEMLTAEPTSGGPAMLALSANDGERVVATARVGTA